PTALFVGNDKMAVGVFRALAGARVQVPHDIAVVGFDDIEISEYLDPPLTTVHADAYRLGERAVERVMRLMNEVTPGESRHEILPTTLVVRRSCGTNDSRTEPARGPRTGPGRKTRRTALGRP